MDRHLLIVVRDFPPYYPSPGGVLRMLKLADFLQRRGFQVHVLAARGRECGAFGCEELLRRLDVRYLADPVQRMRTRARTAEQDAAAGGATAWSPWRGFKRWVDEVSVPDPGAFFVSRYVRLGAELIRRHAIRAMVVSSPPHSTQLIGLRLKRRFGQNLRYFCDYRDSWNTTPLFAKRTAGASRRSMALERAVLEAADHLTYVSPPMLGKLERTFFPLAHKATLVMNGYDAETADRKSAAAPPAEGPLTVGHFGALSDSAGSYRNPAGLFEALMRVEAPIRLELYGAAEVGAQWRERLGRRLLLSPALPHREALEQMRRMHVLLVLHSEPCSGDEVLTTKLFDYLSARRPVLVAGPEEMEAARMVRELGIGCVSDPNDPAGLARRLAELHAAWREGRLPDCSRADIEAFSREKQYEKLLPLLEQAYP